MAETVNIGEIAMRLSNDIFKHFNWRVHPKRDDNFECHNSAHASKTGVAKQTHPGDVIFYYDDPYLGKRIYLHSDLKSYGRKSISKAKVEQAFKSLAMTISCALESDAWRTKYCVDQDEAHEIRGFLFVHNHDNKYAESFHQLIGKVGMGALIIPPGALMHFVGPDDIQRLYSITNDIIRLKHDGILPGGKTSFYYPDLVNFKRIGDVWEQPATIEQLTGPFVIIKYLHIDNPKNKGYVVYYNRNGDVPEEFQYFLDCLSRFQMLESGEKINVRMTSRTTNADFKSIFETAKAKYVRGWGFDPVRQQIVDSIAIEKITSVTTTYNPGEIGWRE